MELDDLKKIWQETPIQNKSNINIMELIRDKHYGPLASLKNTYRRQIRMMAVVPLLLVAANMNEVGKVLTSVLFWSYVVFCLGLSLFARYNYRIVKSMQAMDAMVKSNLEQQISLLEKRAKLEMLALRATLLYFIVLLEVVPYFQQYSMLNKWHALPLLTRIASYAGVLLLQYFVSGRIKERKVGRHLAYLKELVAQMK